MLHSEGEIFLKIQRQPSDNTSTSSIDSKLVTTKSKKFSQDGQDQLAINELESKFPIKDDSLDFRLLHMKKEFENFGEEKRVLIKNCRQVTQEIQMNFRKMADILEAREKFLLESAENETKSQLEKLRSQYETQINTDMRKESYEVS